MDVQGCSFKLAHNTTEISKHIVASLALQIGQSILCAEDDVCKQVGIGMSHGGLHWAKGGPIIRRRPGFAPKKGLIFRRIAGPRPAAVATFFRRCAAHLDASSMLTPQSERGLCSKHDFMWKTTQIFPVCL